MIWLAPGRWCGLVGALLQWERIYTRKGRWTPLVRARLRYRVGWRKA